MHKVHFSSETDLWATPQKFFNAYNLAYGFDLDVCAIESNAKCARYFTPEMDGLRQPWAPHVCWMNPPYGREVGKWVHKAYEESLRGAIVVCLLPSRTDTCWYHNWCKKGYIEFLQGRLRFGDSKTNAPFPNMVVIFG